MKREWWKASYPPRFTENRDEAKRYPTKLFAEVLMRDLNRAVGTSVSPLGIDVTASDVERDERGWLVWRFKLEGDQCSQCDLGYHERCRGGDCGCGCRS
jgi:hypothetical protein